MSQALKGCCRFMFTVLFVVGFFDAVVAVRINRLQVPEVAQLGEPVVLDCDYTLDGSLVEDLVVKWFFNEKPNPVYQWIPNNKPKESAILKGRVNLNYSASKDTNSVHRALHIIQPGPDLSGNYTCTVSTSTGEDSKTKGMLVLVPEKTLELRQEYKGNRITEVMCYAEGVFPKPSMSLHMGNSEVNNSVIQVEEREGLYNIRAAAEMPSLEAPKEFSCELHIPQANYTVRKEAIYYPVNEGFMLGPHLLLIFASFLLFQLLLYVR